MERKWWTLVAVCLGVFMLLLDITIVNVALPSIQHDLHATFSDLEWVVDAYALSLAALLLSTGTLADLFGRRLLFAIGLVIFTVGSLLCALATNPLFLVLSRAGQGIGGAIIFATSLALLADAFRGRERATALAIWGAVTGIAVAIGPLVGGLITSGWTWRGIFLVNLPVGVIAVAITLLLVAESRDPHPRGVDWAGLASFTAALIALVYGLIRAGDYGWGNLGVVVCLACAAVLLAVFLVVERFSSRSMIDLALFRVPTFGGGSVAAFAMNGTVYALLLYIIIYLQDDLGFSALQTGLRALILSVATLPAAIASGRLTSRVPTRFLIGPGLALCGIGLLLMAGLTAGSSWTHLIPGLVLAGVGSGMVNPALAGTAVGVVPPRQAGMASGMNTTFRQVGIATGIAVFGTLFATRATSAIVSGLRGTAAEGHAQAIATAVKQGEATQAIGSLPLSARHAVVVAVRSAFASGLNEILVVSGIAALVAAVASLALIRQKDFAAGAPSGARPAGAGAEPVSGSGAATAERLS
jgi:EmrB/QacA subfamily drug resistance transporter